jgi:hypothetical protein
MSALQLAHSGGLRMRADLPDEVGSGWGARVTMLGPAHAASRHSVSARIRRFMDPPSNATRKDYASLALAAYSSSRPRMQFR